MYSNTITIIIIILAVAAFVWSLIKDIKDTAPLSQEAITRFLKKEDRIQYNMYEEA